MPANAKGGGRERGPQPAAPPQAPARRDGAARRLTYKDAGVDIDAKMRAIQKIRLIARGTFIEFCLINRTSISMALTGGPSRARTSVACPETAGLDGRCRAMRAECPACHAGCCSPYAA